MKLLDLEIHNFRGIRHLHLQPGQKNMLIFGPNGSGKSSVVDAVDFLLTGRISRLSGPGTGRISYKKHGTHINSDPCDAYVVAKFSVPDHNPPVTLSRCMEHPNELKCEPPSAQKHVDQIVQLALHGHHILTRREILHYITAEDGTRAQEIQALLSLTEIEKIRQSFISTITACKQAHKKAENDLRQAREKICVNTAQQTYQDTAVLAQINHHRRLLGGGVLSVLSSRNIKQGLKAPTVLEMDPKNQISLLENDLQNLAALLQPGFLDGFRNTEIMLRETIELLDENQPLKHLYSRQKILDFGLTLVDETGDCPLCGIHWEPGQLKEHLEKECANANQSMQYHRRMTEWSGAMNNIITGYIPGIQKISGAAQLLNLSSEHKHLQAWKAQLEHLSSVLENAVDQYVIAYPNQSRVHGLLAPANLPEILQKIQTEAKTQFPGMTPEQRSWDMLTRLEENLQSLEQAQLSLSHAEISLKRANLLKNEFEHARDSVLNALYDSIKNRFVELYRTLHGEDEGNFDAVMKPEGAGLVFEVDFHGHGSHPPHAMHSEGHQDSMGVCLYLALAEKLTRGKIDMIILDDVVMSVDAGHRRQLCRLFTKYFSDRQIILTTHDKTWATQLKNEGVINSKNSLEFFDWDLLNGPKINDTSDIWDLIRQDLNKNDISAAAARLRRGSEEFFATVCDVLQAQVRYKEGFRWELGDFLPAAQVRLKDLIKKALTSAESWGNQDLKKQLLEIDSKREDVVKRSASEQWGINAEVHYNGWANMSREDFTPIVDAFHDLWDLFRCDKCHSVLHLLLDKGTAARLSCSCGAVNWNLIKKDGKHE